MTSIPMSQDLRETIGPLAEKVSNRSLLLDKFILPKDSPNGTRLDSAYLLNLLRLSHQGSTALHTFANERRNEQFRDIALCMAKTCCDSTEITNMRIAHSQRLLLLMRKSFGERTALLGARLESRLAINLATGVMQNAGISLDPLTGAPFIPGSAVKGVARKAAYLAIKQATEGKRQLVQDFLEIFGYVEDDLESPELAAAQDVLKLSKEKKGCINFLPAYPLNDARIVVDITNVHYPDYYGSGDIAALRKETPRPNYFPVVEQGGEFAFMLLLTRTDTGCKRLLDLAGKWLREGLEIHAIGGKTAAGYGCFKIDETLVPESIKSAEALETHAKAEREKRLAKEADRAAEAQAVANASPIDKVKIALGKLNPQGFVDFANALTMKSSDEQVALLTLCLEDKKFRDRVRGWKKENRPQVEILKNVATIHDEILKELLKKLSLPNYPWS